MYQVVMGKVHLNVRISKVKFNSRLKCQSIIRMLECSNFSKLIKPFFKVFAPIYGLRPIPYWFHWHLKRRWHLSYVIFSWKELISRNLDISPQRGLLCENSVKSLMEYTNWHFSRRKFKDIISFTTFFTNVESLFASL